MSSSTKEKNDQVPRVTMEDVDNWWKLSDEERKKEKDPRGTAPSIHHHYSYDEQRWINQKGTIPRRSFNLSSGNGAEPKYVTTLISGPSGSGKTALANDLATSEPDNLVVFDEFDPYIMDMEIEEFLKLLKRETTVKTNAGVVNSKPKRIIICSLKSMEQILKDISNKFSSTHADEFKKLVTNCVTLPEQSS